MKKDSLRIQFTERFVNMSDEDLESYRNLNPSKTFPYAYRLIYPRLEDVFQPREIPGKKNHCEVEFTDGSFVIVKGSYDDICNQIDEREKILDQYKEECGE